MSNYVQPPDGLVVVERFAVDVALTLARDNGGPPVEQFALLVSLIGHENGGTAPATVRAIVDTAGAAKLTGALLEALDRMRERSHTPPS